MKWFILTLGIGGGLWVGIWLSVEWVWWARILLGFCSLIAFLIVGLFGWSVGNALDDFEKMREKFKEK